MKKTGFTLAEVLITLAIIGVVATMTLPALMTNTNEQQARTGVKKGINTLTHAVELNNAPSDAGYDFAGISSAVTDIDTINNDGLMAMNGILYNHTQVDRALAGLGNRNDATSLVSTGEAGGGDGNTFVAFLRDGSAVVFNPADTTDAAGKVLQADGLPLGFVVVYDTNGQKGPNILSTCEEGVGATRHVDAALGTADYDRQVMADLAAGNLDALDQARTHCTNANRVIRDQFALRLRGTTVIPEGDAAVWAAMN